MVLERGEKLELLVDKTEQLQNSAFTFQKQSKKLKNAMFWKKVRAGLWTESQGKPLPRDDFSLTPFLSPWRTPGQMLCTHRLLRGGGNSHNLHDRLRGRFQSVRIEGRRRRR